MYLAWFILVKLKSILVDIRLQEENIENRCSWELLTIINDMGCDIQIQTCKNDMMIQVCRNVGPRVYGSKDLEVQILK